MNWQNALLVAAGGALGSVLRYAVTVAAAARFGTAFPFGTLVVNVVGSFLIGAIAELATGPLSPAGRLFLATGICGGFTTFSSLSLDALMLERDGAPVMAGMYLVGSVLLGMTAVVLGVAAVRTVRA